MNKPLLQQISGPHPVMFCSNVSWNTTSSLRAQILTIWMRNIWNVKKKSNITHCHHVGMGVGTQLIILHNLVSPSLESIIKNTIFIMINTAQPSLVQSFKSRQGIVKSRNGVRQKSLLCSISPLETRNMIRYHLKSKISSLPSRVQGVFEHVPIPPLRVSSHQSYNIFQDLTPPVLSHRQTHQQTNPKIQ